MREPDLRPQSLLENLPLESADVSILLGQLLIGTVVLSQNRQRPVAADFDVVTAAKQRITQPLHAFLQVVLAESSQPPNSGRPARAS